MLTAVKTAFSLAWGEWVRGVIGAFVSGGAGAIGAATGVSAFDPSHDIQGATLVKVMGVAFVTSGVISMAKFLQTHPVPDKQPPPAAA